MVYEKKLVCENVVLYCVSASSTKNLLTILACLFSGNFIHKERVKKNRDNKTKFHILVNGLINKRQYPFVDYIVNHFLHFLKPQL